VTTLELAEARVPMRRVGSEWHGPCPACGAGNSGEAKTDRFSVKADGRWFCRTCPEPSHGDAVGFLRKFENMSCAEAHAALGKECRSTSCPAERCPQRNAPPAAKAIKPLLPPKPAAVAEFVPAVAISPEEKWRQSAEKLIERAHAALLDCPEQLAYVAGRGLPREAVEKYRLGWLAADLYRPRVAWGLPEILREDGKPKKLWLPQGILIPTFDAAGVPIRLNIRRPKIKEGEIRYYRVPGSGDDIPVLNPQARAHVVVESDLDACLIAWHAGDLVGAIPLATCSAKPKESAVEILRKALCILVATDFEPRENAKTGRHENPGGKSALWWQQQFPRAKRWPVPIGKDPGEFFKDHAGDIRAWVLAGLPPVFHLPAPVVPEKDSTVSHPEASVSGPAPIAADQPAMIRREGKRSMILVHTLGQFRRMIEENPGVAVVGSSELPKIPPEISEVVLLVKEIFGDAKVRLTRPIVGDGSSGTVIWFDPSRQRRAMGR